MQPTPTRPGRRVLGWLFLIIGVILLLGTLLQLPGALGKAADIGGSRGLGYAVGSLLLGVVGIWLLRLGLRWRRGA